SKAQDFISKLSDENDNSEYRLSDIADPSQLLTSSQFMCFDESYVKMKETQKWILSSEICIKDVIFKHCNKLLAKSLLYSWIIYLND
ncbi:1653_t:CDS:2, partial [Funneliformis caledonium]